MTDGEGLTREQIRKARGELGLIAAYGVLWRVPVKPTDPLNLKGVRRGGMAPVIDFKRQRGIYILYSSFGPRYVGKSWKNDLGGRLESHLTDSHRGQWDRFSWFGFRRVIDRGGKLVLADDEPETIPSIDPRGALRDLETVIIRGFGLHNVRPGHFNNADEWMQVDFSDVGVR